VELNDFDTEFTLKLRLSPQGSSRYYPIERQSKGGINSIIIKMPYNIFYKENKLNQFISYVIFCFNN